MIEFFIYFFQSLLFIKLFLLIENFLFWNHLDCCLLNCLFALFFILFILQRDLVLYQLHCFLHSFIELFKQLSQLLQSEIVKIIWDNCDFGHYIFINKKICFFKFDFLITKRKLGRRLTKKYIFYPHSFNCLLKYIIIFDVLFSTEVQYELSISNYSFFGLFM